MATSVDAKIQKSTKFPVEFNQKVDMQKVRTEVVKKWIASRISDILGNEDDVVIEMIYNLIEEKRFPDIKKIQIQLTGFLDKDTASFCKELWKLCLSAQSSPQGVPKELLEAKKLEIIQEKIESEKLAEQARKRRDDEQNRERDINAIRQRERGDRGRGGPGRGGDSWRGGRGGRGDDRNREFDRRPGRDFDRRGPRHSRSPRRRDSRERSYRAPPLREADTYVPRGRGEPRRDMRDQRRRPSESVSPPPKREASESRSRSPPRRRYRSQSTSRTPPRRRRSVHIGGPEVLTEGIDVEDHHLWSAQFLAHHGLVKEEGRHQIQAVDHLHPEDVEGTQALSRDQDPYRRPDLLLDPNLGQLLFPARPAPLDLVVGSGPERHLHQTIIQRLELVRVVNVTNVG
ncbi:PWI [Glarea lozoyensis ATCC 20868]|uniref:PWI n=1 Tax=Glarea lozoyensis (strain ATCC 20868 / MF5171) TaxID=1116229 RepID=S3DE72_GLAL2|nr:PWI [Glarea lozoyensis ATCC 20868]EPE36055.1 PWI [Glarea lozoyensis ATCC 20868]